MQPFSGSKTLSSRPRKNSSHHFETMNNQMLRFVVYFINVTLMHGIYYGTLQGPVHG